MIVNKQLTEVRPWPKTGQPVQQRRRSESEACVIMEDEFDLSKGCDAGLTRAAVEFAKRVGS